MSTIRNYIKSTLLEPLKEYRTIIGDTMLEIITQRLEELYEYTLRFPEIVSPTQNRLDILKTIAEQFSFTIREDADLQEQIAILEKILYVYKKRGSIDTIENMWTYYGGKLPRDVKVVIPSYNLFRYSVSALSGTHVFQDNKTNRTGVYEVNLINNTYPIPELKDFMLKELVAAGNYIYFTNTLHSNLLGEDAYKYLVDKESLLYIQLDVLKANQGLTWSGYNPLSRKSEDSAWSGRGSIFLEFTKMIEYPIIKIEEYKPDLLGFWITINKNVGIIRYCMIPIIENLLSIESFLYCTPLENSLYISRYLYNSQGELLESSYPGYFVLHETLLGEEVI